MTSAVHLQLPAGATGSAAPPLTVSTSRPEVVVGAQHGFLSPIATESVSSSGRSQLSLSSSRSAIAGTVYPPTTSTVPRGPRDTRHVLNSDSNGSRMASPSAYSMRRSGSSASIGAAEPHSNGGADKRSAASVVPLVVAVAGSGSPGFDDGMASTASFDQPSHVALDPTTGDPYLSDVNNNAIRVRVVGVASGAELPACLHRDLYLNCHDLFLHSVLPLHAVHLWRDRRCLHSGSSA